MIYLQSFLLLLQLIVATGLCAFLYRYLGVIPRSAAESKVRHIMSFFILGEITLYLKLVYERLTNIWLLVHDPVQAYVIFSHYSVLFIFGLNAAAALFTIYALISIQRMEHGE